MKTPLSMFVLGLLSLCPIPAAAQQPAETTSYPARSVKVVVPYPPGAAADIIGRLVAQKLSELTGSQFYVENLPGAGGVIGTATAARAPADGYTILVMNQDFVVQPAVKSKVPYDPFKTFIPVASIAAAPETISVHPSLPATSMKELIALLKANPGKYSYASPGHGTSPHIACERLFKLTYGLDVVHVPFQGGAPAVTATLAGHTQILHITLPLAAPYIKEGKLRGLAVADKRRASPRWYCCRTLRNASRRWVSAPLPVRPRSSPLTSRRNQPNGDGLFARPRSTSTDAFSRADELWCAPRNRGAHRFRGAEEMRAADPQRDAKQNPRDKLCVPAIEGVA